jgi:hypothetical protein
MKIPPNNPCPCRSGKKFKKCCRGRVDWESIFDDSNKNPTEHLSIRGKNIFFLERIAEALQLDRLDAPIDRASFKKRFTTKAVRSIAEAIVMTWPSGKDLRRALSEERANTAGLYVGTYDPDAIQRGVTRHSLYSDTLLLADPLLDPRRTRPQYSPIENPEQHRSSTLRWVTLWLALTPWIEKGILKFIRTPGDFDAELDFRLMNQARRRHAEEPELAALQDAFVTNEGDALMESYKRQMQLSMPDSYLRGALRRWKPSVTDSEIEGVLEYIQQRRDSDPYFIETIDKPGGGELLQITTGMNYDEAKLTAVFAGAHLVTDLEVRWKELEIDKMRGGFDPRGWSPFAKAFQQVAWPYLNNVPLHAALTLREEDRLADMRAFLRKAWRAAAPAQAFDASAATNLETELNERVREAEAEWMAIDRDLIKWFGTELTAGVLGMAPAIAMGAASWAAGGVAAAAATNLLVTQRRRAEWEKRFPAGFFLRLKNQAFGRQAAP